MRKFISLVIMVAITPLSFLNAQVIPLAMKGHVDVAYIYNDPSAYIKKPASKCFVMRNHTRVSSYHDDHAPFENLTSCAILFKSWESLGVLLTQTTFVYELSKESLRGREHWVSYKDISKYPDLVKRYNAIKPTKVRAILGMGLNQENEFDFGAYAFFHVEKELYITPAGKPTDYALITYSTWGETVRMKRQDEVGTYFFVRFEDFQPTDEGKEKYTKIMHQTTRVGRYANIKVSEGVVRKHEPEAEQNIVLEVTWPLEDIDAIYELYQDYESGKEIPPTEQVEKEMADKDLDTYNSDDEWSEPFEDELKDVETVNEKGTIGLKSKGRMVATFSTDQYTRIDPIQNTPYFTLKDKNNKFTVVDKRGNKQTIGGYTTFDAVSRNDKGGLSVQSYLTDSKYIESDYDDYLVTPSKTLYSSFEEASQDINGKREAAEREYQASHPQSSTSSSSDDDGVTEVYINWTPSHYYSCRKVKMITTDVNGKIINTQEGYTVSYW